MSTFAHIETGQVLDPQVNDTAGQYLARYSPEATYGWNVAQVPDGTEHNASVNGDGTYTNPLYIPPPKGTVLSITDFKRRFTMAERMGVFGSTDLGVRVFLDELNTAGTVDLASADTQAGVSYLVSLSLLTQARATAILTP